MISAPCRKILLLACLAVPAGSPAKAAVSDWVGHDDRVRVRLLAAGIENGKLSAGIEIALSPGWKTYWRSPGDAGISPRIDFSASQNVEAPDVAFPVPTRHSEGLAVINVYEDGVTLPVEARIADPGKETVLVLSLDIGIFEDVCVPEHFDVTLTVPADAQDAEAAALLEEARAKLPGKSLPGTLAAEGVKRVGGTERKPVFEIGIVAPDPKKAEVFVEGPPDWSPAPPELVSAEGGNAIFAVEFSRLGAKTPIGGNEFRVTIVTDERAVEQTVTLSGN